MDPQTIKVAEHFFSVQGEGMTIGVPAVFLRLSMCNFSCQWCDTIEVWKKGTNHSLDELDGLFDMSGYYGALRRGAHLVLTGGDPLIQQDALINWFRRLDEFERNTSRFFVEVETQGYIMPKQELLPYIRQWNVSPKLANSGMPYEKRIQKSVLQYHASANSCFKFPIATESDLREAEQIVYSTGMKRSRVYLMPVCATREAHIELAPKIVDLCKKSGFRFSPRLQLLVWDKACGV